MTRLFLLVLLANLAFAHLPSTPAGLRRSAAHKKRLDGQSLPQAAALHRRLSIGVDLGDVPILDPVSPPPSSDTQPSTPPPSSPSSDSSSPSQSPVPPPSESSPPASSVNPTSDPPPSPSVTQPTPSPSDPATTPSQDCGILGLGLFCPSSSGTPSSTDVPPSVSSDPPPQTSDPPSQTSDPPSQTSNPPQTSDPPQTSNPPSTTDAPPPSTTGDQCLIAGIGCLPSSTPAGSDTVSTQPPPPSTTGDQCLIAGIGCPPSSTPVNSDPASTQPPPASSDPVPTQPPPVSSDPVSVQPSPPSATGDQCLLSGIGCPPSSTPVNSDPASTQPPPASSDPVPTQPPPPSTTGDLCLQFGIGCPPSSTPVNSDTVSTQAPPVSSDPVSVQPPPPSTTGDQCLLSGIGCPPSSTPVSSVQTQPPPESSDTVQTQPPPASSDTVTTQPPPPGTTSDLCLLQGIGCLPSSIPASSDTVPTQLPSVSSEPPESTRPPVSTNPPSSEPPGSTQPPSTTDVSLPSDGSSSIPSTPIIFPSDSSGLPSGSIPNSLPISSIPTPPPTPSNTQFEWLTQTSLIFSSISESTSGSLSLTDPDQVPTTTSFSTAGTPSVAPSVAPLPSGLPARIIPGAGGVNPEVDNLDGFTLIAILFDSGLNWDTVAHNPDSPGQIFSWLPVLILSALDVTSDQVKSFALQVWIPNSYTGPSDVSQLGTTWLGYIPSPLVETLAAQIKVRTSSFYTGQPSPYSDLAAHVNSAFDIMTVTATTGIPGSGGPNGGTPSGGASEDSRTRENAIIGVVSALGGITLIVLGYLIYRAVKKRRELAHRRISDPPTDPFVGEAPPNRNFDQDSIGGQRRRSFYFAEDSLRGFSDHSYTNDGARLNPEQASGLNRRPIAGNIGPPVMRENSLNF